MGTSTVLIVGGVVVATGTLAVLVKKSIRKDGSKNTVNQRTENEDSKPNLIMARKAFLEHLDDFSTLLPLLESGVEINRENFNKWTATIISINDKDLTDLWTKYLELYKTNIYTKWIQLLASWQVKRDTCKSFTCLTNSNIASYTLPDGSALMMDVKYKVITPCWVYTFEDEYGKTTKRIISKGIVVPIQEKS